MEILGDQITVGTLHSYMLGLAVKDLPTPDREGFWQEDLPLLALERLLDSGGSDPFDLLLIDEAQDLLDDQYLDVLDLSLVGGLSGGAWRLFGDFERQSIYGNASIALQDFLVGRGASAPVYSLRTNCRSTPRLATLVRLLSHLDPDYVRVLRPEDGVEPELHFYADDRNGSQLLIQILSVLEQAGYAGDDVVVLSPRASDSTAARVRDQPWCDRLRPLSEAAHRHIQYGTIHGFKGLEAPAIVVTDIDSVPGATAEALFYVAVTRATQRLHILIADSVRASLARLLAGTPIGGEGAHA